MKVLFFKLTRELHESITSKFTSGNDVVDNFINGTECLDPGVGVTYVIVIFLRINSRRPRNSPMRRHPVGTA